MYEPNAAFRRVLVLSARAPGPERVDPTLREEGLVALVYRHRLRPLLLRHRLALDSPFVPPLKVANPNTSTLAFE